MASILKVDKLDPQSGTALEIGTSGDTINVPSGVTLDINSGATLDATGATVTGAIGITASSFWRLTTTFAGDASPIASNLEVADDASYGSLGSAMTQSSGIFTFPLTGYWLVGFGVQFNANSADGRCAPSIQATINDSAYDTVCEFSVAANTTGAYNNGYGQALIDVTDVANVKVRFSQNQVTSDSNSTYGSTDANVTFMSFTRLGDT